MRGISKWVLLLYFPLLGALYGSFLVDPNPPVYWLPGEQYEPSIAGGSNGFFAV